MKSYNDIDYRLRLRKFVERNMIKESCQRLFYFDSLDNYRYIGLGSLYFVDFKLFHKYLGIKDMISIEEESDPNKQIRFNFNKPYNFIEMNFKKSTDALIEIDFDKRCIVWLDYDDNLKGYMFEDLQILIDNILSGSVFILSLNTSINGKKTSKLVIELRKLMEELKQMEYIHNNLAGYNFDEVETILAELISNLSVHRKERLRKYRKIKDVYKKLEVVLGKNSETINKALNNVKELTQYENIIKKIIILLKNEDNCREKNFRVERFMEEYQDYLTRDYYEEKELTDKNSHIVIKEMFDMVIDKTIRNINNTKSDEDKLIYKQLYYFTYKDGASMMTLGGIIFKKSEEEYYNKAYFDKINYIRFDNNNYQINIPKLTEKEMNYLDNEALFGEEAVVSIQNTYKDIEKERILYNSVYRYLPHFTSIDNI